MSRRVRIFATSFPMGKVQYSCIMCGMCCKTYLAFNDLELSVREMDKLLTVIKNQFVLDITSFFKKHDVLFEPHENGTGVINFRGKCPFLSRNLCVIHSRKPLACDLFPFVVEPNPDSGLEWSNAAPILVDMVRCPGYGTGETIDEYYIERVVNMATAALGIDIIDKFREQGKKDGPAWMSSIGQEPIPLSTERKFISYVIKYIDSTEANSYPMSVGLLAMSQSIPEIKNFFARLREIIEPGYDEKIKKKASDIIETFFWEYLAEIFEKVSDAEPVESNTKERNTFEDPFYGKMKIEQDSIREIVNGIFMSPRAKDMMIDYLVEFSGRSRAFMPHIGIDLDLTILAMLAREIEVRSAAYALFERKTRVDDKVMEKAIDITDMLSREITLRGLRYIDPHFESWEEDVPWITRYKPTGASIFLISKNIGTILMESEEEEAIK